MNVLRPFTELGQKAYDSALLIKSDLAGAARLQQEIRGVDKKISFAAEHALKAEREKLLLETRDAFETINASGDVSEDTLRFQKKKLAEIRRGFDGEIRAIQQIRSQSAFASTRKRVLIPDRFLDEVDEPYYNAGNPPRVFDPLFETALTMHAKGEVLPTDKAVIIFLHGAGAMFSSSNALLGLMNDLAQLETDGIKTRAFATIGVDLPFHGFGVHDENLKENVPAYMEYLHGIVSHYAAMGKPVFLFGRSFGAVSAVEYATRYNDIKGVIHMSGLHRDWVAENIANMHANNFPINPEGLDFANGIMQNLTYFDGGAKPLVGGLLLYGLKDVEYDPAKQRALWPILGAALGFGVLGFEEGEHNLFDPKNPAVHKAARAAVQDFILKQIGER